MHTTYEKRKQQRSILANLGFGIVILGAIAFVIGLIGVLVGIFGDIDDKILSMYQLLLWAIYIVCFGVLFTLTFGRIGWHDNAIVDFLLNQVSVVLVVTGAGSAVIANIFFDSHNGSVVGIGTAVLGFAMALIGICLHTTPAR